MHKKFLRISLFCLGISLMVIGIPSCCYSTPFGHAIIHDDTPNHAISPRYELYANEQKLGYAQVLISGPSRELIWENPIHTFKQGTKIKVTRTYGIVKSYYDEWNGILEFDTSPTVKVFIEVYKNGKLGVRPIEKRN